MAHTGHRSIEGVRTYKRISEQQVKDVSTLLNDATNGALAAKKCKVTHESEQETTTTNSLVPQASIAAQAGTCTVHSGRETVTNTLIPSAFHFTGCSKYKLDVETKGSTVFRNPWALGCSDSSAARALLRARGFLNTVDPVGRGI